MPGDLSPRTVLSGVLLAWCVLATGRVFQLTLAKPADPMSELESEFRPMAAYLPPFGEVGYLEAYDGPTEEAVRMHYAAQYALVPRLIVGRAGAEFLIVARGTARGSGDVRLIGFHPVASFSGGHRLYQRDR
jgi:hypothetical protein